MKKIIIQILVFIILFNVLYFSVRFFTGQHQVLLTVQNPTLPSLFSAIILVFSIISGFIIQSKWNTWNSLIDATHEELTAIRELHILSYHFPKSIQNKIKEAICNYLESNIESAKDTSKIEMRSNLVDKAIFHLEETIFGIDHTEHDDIRSMNFDLVRTCMESREKRLQNILHKLPIGVKVFLSFITFITIVTSIFISNTISIYDYFFTFVIALVTYGVYLLIDDLDHPYRPGQWRLSMQEYHQLLDEINNNRL